MESDSGEFIERTNFEEEESKLSRTFFMFVYSVVFHSDEILFIILSFFVVQSYSEKFHKVEKSWLWVGLGCKNVEISQNGTRLKIFAVRSCMGDSALFFIKQMMIKLFT